MSILKMVHRIAGVLQSPLRPIVLFMDDFDEVWDQLDDPLATDGTPDHAGTAN